MTSHRNHRLWLPTKLGDRHPQNVHHDRECQVGNGCRERRRFNSCKTDPAKREDSSKITIQATGATSWRRSDVKYRKNEAFVDVIETVNLLMSREGGFCRTKRSKTEHAAGSVLRADVDGQILMRAYLSGSPECKFGLNDRLVVAKR